MVLKVEKKTETNYWIILTNKKYMMENYLCQFLLKNLLLNAWNVNY